MPTTPIYALRYPLPTDPADVPVDLQELALDVETKLGGPPVSALPGAPVDGQIVRYRVGTEGPVWTLQYLASSAAPHRWHFLGGAELRATAAGGVQMLPVGSWSLYQPQITAPLAGVYRCWGRADFNHGNAGVIASTVHNGSAYELSRPFGTTQSWAGGVQSAQDGETVPAAVGAGAIFSWSFYVGVPAMVVNNIALSIRPIRVS